MATIEIDGKAYQVDNGKMIIEVTDELGIHIPRFCYHKKLSVAANCRMCLVQIENSRKPVPACATPITDGMKVHTQSEETLRSQKAVMEFLLINHPLDCPICDQGGECELQDVSMGFGTGESAYYEAKRVVNDDNLGALIATDMTRCIQCTRCVRFGEEIAGVRELGATGRGENMQIGTYVQHAMTSEVSGNIIDLCPVGALTSKPYRFTARAWELTQFASIAPHDCIGSSVHVHVLAQAVKRVVPKEQEQINETWLSDRDRFSYLGLSHPNRAQFPRIKQAGKWKTVDWPTALEFAAKSIAECINKHGPEQFAAFCSPSSTLEEMYLLQRWMRELGVNNLDHRLQQTDCSDQSLASLMPSSSLPYANLEAQNTVLLLGTHLHREVPLAAVRVRKSSLLGGKVFAINPVDYSFPFTVSEKIIVSPSEMIGALGKILLACVTQKDALPLEIQGWLKNIQPDEQAQLIAAALKEPNAVIVTGAIAENHPQASILRSLVHYISLHTSAKILRLTVGANSNGGWIAGMLPHRAAFGKASSQIGLSAKDSIEKQLKGYCLLGVDEFDFAHAAQVRQAMLGAECVIALTAFDDPELEAYANVILPIGVYTETSGTYVNVDQNWQTFTGCSRLQGEARPAWKVLRVLANLMDCPQFTYENTQQILEELQAGFQAADDKEYQPFLEAGEVILEKAPLVRVGEWPMYGVDALVRHASLLQGAASADSIAVKVHPETAAEYGIIQQVTVSQGTIAVTLPLEQDERVAKGTVYVLNGLLDTMDLGYSFAEIEIIL